MAIIMTRVFDRDETPVSAPLTYCDVCNRPIEDFRIGAYAWFYEGPYEIGQQAQIYFTHKDKCLDALEAKHEGKVLRWNELRDFPIFLARNLNMDTKGRWPKPPIY